MVESDQQHIFGARTQQHLIFESHGHQVIELSTDTWTDGIIKVDQNPSKATVRTTWVATQARALLRM